jgi:Holliday junction resolvase RusA-like endonuclease
MIIYGSLPTLNEVTASNRTNKYVGAKLKRDAEELIMLQLPSTKITGLIDLDIKWVVKDNRKDADNVYSAVKFLLDAMVKKGVLQGDGRKYVRNISHSIYTLPDAAINQEGLIIEWSAV